MSTFGQLSLGGAAPAESSEINKERQED